MKVTISSGVVVDVDVSKISAVHHRFLEATEPGLKHGDGDRIVRAAEAGLPTALAVLATLAESEIGLPLTDGSVMARSPAEITGTVVSSDTATR
jgi:hypothetical protein